MNKSGFLRQNVLPVLAAFIWGTAFVAQSVGAERVETFTFNTARSLVAFPFLTAVWVLLRLRGKGREAAPLGGRRDLALGGLLCGGALTLGSAFQQMGLATTTPGKAGFITALYIVIVPVLGIFLKKRVGKTVWLGVVLAVAGLYCLCIQQGFAVAKGDFFVFLCSLCFSAHILAVDRFAQRVDGLALSCAQFLVAGVLSAIGMVALEQPDWEAVLSCAGPILYAGILSSGVGYTLQILAQKDSNPTVVSLLLSLESVFAVLAGAVILGERMSRREILGCVLMFLAVILAQLPDKRGRDQTAGPEQAVTSGPAA